MCVCVHGRRRAESVLHELLASTAKGGAQLVEKHKTFEKLHSDVQAVIKQIAAENEGGVPKQRSDAVLLCAMEVNEQLKQQKRATPDDQLIASLQTVISCQIRAWKANNIQDPKDFAIPKVRAVTNPPAIAFMTDVYVNTACAAIHDMRCMCCIVCAGCVRSRVCAAGL